MLLVYFDLLGKNREPIRVTNIDMKRSSHLCEGLAFLSFIYICFGTTSIFCMIYVIISLLVEPKEHENFLFLIKKCIIIAIIRLVEMNLNNVNSNFKQVIEKTKQTQGGNTESSN
jgi:hypothetical protein